MTVIKRCQMCGELDGWPMCAYCAGLTRAEPSRDDDDLWWWSR